VRLLFDKILLLSERYDGKWFVVVAFRDDEISSGAFQLILLVVGRVEEK